MATFDGTEKLKAIASTVDNYRKMFVPNNLREPLDQLCHFITHYRETSPPTSSSSSVCTDELQSAGSAIVQGNNSSIDLLRLAAPDCQYNVKVNAKTKLDTLYRYRPGKVAEYPTTSSTGRIGHLFEIDLQSEWVNPAKSFAYSQGEPRGSNGTNLYCLPLVDDDGNKVPCTEYHSTCA